MKIYSFIFENVEIPEGIESIQDYLDEFFYIPNDETLFMLFQLEKNKNPNFWFKKLNFPNYNIYSYGFKNKINEYGRNSPEFILHQTNKGYDSYKAENWLDDVIAKDMAFDFVGIDMGEELNKEFWDFPQTLYHATSDSKKLESILKNGLKPKNETRGLSNRHIGNAIFTSLEPAAIDAYVGKTGGIIQINTIQMKKDGYTPRVFYEPEVEEQKMLSILYSLVGIEQFHDYSSGIDENTIILKDEIPAKYLKLMDEDILTEMLKEPKRQNPKTFQQLGIEKGKGLQNIINIYNDLEPEEKEYWGKWYKNAKLDVEELATKYNVPFPIMAGVVACMSPGNKWSSNLVAADRLFYNISNPSDARKINSYGRDIKKALKIIQTGDLSNATGPKVSVFLKSLLNPQAVENEIVLDSHAINIWRGEKRKIKGSKMPTIAEREQIINDYKKASEILGVSLQALQACTWYSWKYTAEPYIVPQTNIPAPAIQQKLETINKSKKHIDQIKSNN